MDQISIRIAQPDDAEALTQLRLRLDNETEFMLYEPGERVTNSERTKQRLEEMAREESGAIFVAELAGQLVGLLQVTRSPMRRLYHKLYIVIGIIQECTGQGLGNRLFQAMEEWANRRHLHRLELTVMAHNQAGIALYQKRGFVVEGKQHDALFVNGRYVDELLMAKILT